jgi:UDP-glucuronate 4-epimerase
MTKPLKRALITGGLGFIGSHLVEKLLAQDLEICVIDNLDNFYDLNLKRDNLKRHQKSSGYKFIEGDIRDDLALRKVFEHEPFDCVVHLAALAGVRPSLMRPAEYIDVNIRGTQKLIDCTRAFTGTKFIFASSSSVYGSRTSESFKEIDSVGRPESPYAASKAAGELLCHAAHQCFELDVVCLRFFTVFGPRQRPDLAINKFCRLIESGQPIEIYGDGSSQRDYTYIDDTVSGILSSMQSSLSGFEIINLGQGKPVTLNDMVSCLEKSLGKEAVKIFRPNQTGDVPNTHADIEKARRLLNYSPQTTLAAGIDKFVSWYRGREA